MIYVIGGFLLTALLACLVGLAMCLGYDLVEFTFHPPIFVKLKLTRTDRRKYLTAARPRDDQQS